DGFNFNKDLCVLVADLPGKVVDCIAICVVAVLYDHLGLRFAPCRNQNLHHLKFHSLRSVSASFRSLTSLSNASIASIMSSSQTSLITYPSKIITIISINL